MVIHWFNYARSYKVLNSCWLSFWHYLHSAWMKSNFGEQVSEGHPFQSHSFFFCLILDEPLCSQHLEIFLHVPIDIYFSIYLSNIIYEEEYCLVCLFAIHSVLVIVSVTSYSMALLYIQMKIEVGMTQSSEGRRGSRVFVKEDHFLWFFKKWFLRRLKLQRNQDWDES